MWRQGGGAVTKACGDRFTLVYKTKGLPHRAFRESRRFPLPGGSEMDGSPHDGTVRGQFLLRPSRLVIKTERPVPENQIAPARSLNSNPAEDLPAEFGADAETADIAVEIQGHRP